MNSEVIVLGKNAAIGSDEDEVVCYQAIQRSDVAREHGGSKCLLSYLDIELVISHKAEAERSEGAPGFYFRLPAIDRKLAKTGTSLNRGSRNT